MLYRLESISTTPYLSALRVSHLTGSNLYEGRGRSALRSPRGQVVDRIQGPVVDAPAQLVASGEHEPGELLVRFRAQGRDHEVAAQEADRVLHAALLMTCVRVAEAHVEPVMRDERLEHAGERDLAFGIPMPGAGRVAASPACAERRRYARTRP